MGDDFADRLAAHATEHFGKPPGDLLPGEREVAERSVRLVMEREQREAEKAAEVAERRRELATDQAEHYMLVSGMTVFARDQLDRDEIRAVNAHDQLCALLLSGIPCDCGWPASVRREVAFKRKLLDEIIPKVETMAQEIWNEWGGPNFDVIDAEALLRELCATWRDHPGYQHQWAPPS